MNRKRESGICKSWRSLPGSASSTRFGVRAYDLTHDELIVRTRAHLKPLSSGASPDIFAEARVLDAALVLLGDDLDLNETMRKAEKEAALEALKAVADEFVGFLGVLLTKSG